MLAHRTPADLRIERQQVYDRGIVMTRMRGYSNAEVARLNACAVSTVRNTLRRYGVTDRTDGRWHFCISDKRAAMLDITVADMECTGATRRWPDIWQSATPLRDPKWCQRVAG